MKNFADVEGTVFKCKHYPDGYELILGLDDMHNTCRIRVPRSYPERVHLHITGHLATRYWYKDVQLGKVRMSATVIEAETCEELPDVPCI